MSYNRRTPRRGRTTRRVWMRSEDDMPLSLLALIAPKKPRGRKQSSTPRKKVVSVRAPAAAAVATTPEIIDLDNTPETVEMLNNVNSKVGNFLQSGSFISSDEDETEMIKAKTNKKPSPNPFFISDDSDDDCNIVKQPGSTSSFDICKPSTSAGTSSIPSKDNKMQVDDDIMVLVDTVLNKKDVKNDDNKHSPLKDIKSLEDYRKETEELLKNASCLLDEIKTGRKPEVEQKKEDSSPKITVGSCPICLEPLASRQASVTVCGHIFCKDCIFQTAQTLKKCPTCRKAINTKKIHPIYF